MYLPRLSTSQSSGNARTEPADDDGENADGCVLGAPADDDDSAEEEGGMLNRISFFPTDVFPGKYCGNP